MTQIERSHRATRCQWPSTEHIDCQQHIKKRQQMRLALFLAVASFIGIVNAPGQTLIDLRSQGKNVDFSGAFSTKPFRTGSSLPSTCNVSEAFLKLSAILGQNIFVCTSTNVWTVQGPPPLPSLFGNNDAVLTNDGSAVQWRTLGGDISGGLTTTVVNRIQGRSVDPTAPLPGQILRWEGTANQWNSSEETVRSVFGRTGDVLPQADDYNFAQISGTVSLAKGGTGATTAATALTNLGAAPATHSHALADLAGISGKQGSGQFLQMFGGGAVNANECAKFDAGGNLISTGETCGSVPNYGQSFSSAVSVPMTHNLHSSDLLVQCYNSENTAIGFNSFVIETPNRATVTFVNPQSGRCVLNASSGSRSVEGVSNLSGSLILDQPIFGNSGADLKVGSKTGTGNEVVVSQSPTIVSPYITDFSNMPHEHSGAGAGGQLGISAIRPSALSGNGTTLATTAGPLTAGRCAQIDSAGNITAASAPCGSDAGGTIISGFGLTGDGTAGSPVSVDVQTVGTRLSATATLEFATINASACSELTIPLPGATTGDEVFLGAPPDIDPGFVWSAYVSYGNTIAVRLCKVTTGSVRPASRVWRATIIRSF
jgi:hypothetical protein